MTQTRESKSYISVPEFYAGKCIFVTGGSGFLGKLLVEKLLWSCPEINKIYLHIRPKKNDSPQTRLADLLLTPVFDRLRERRPQDLEKIIPVAGDLCHPYLGISETDKEKLLRDVSIVFHSAATVRFNEHIRQAVITNVVATKQLVQLSHQMPNLEAFVYFSTAYSNCNRYEVKEEVYDVPFDPEKIIQLMEIIDDDIADACATKIIGNRVNSYVFTKALTEKMLQKECEKLPIIIVRPSAVLSTMKEPFPGWLDSWVGPTPVVAAAATGLMHTVFGYKSKIADIIPADLVVNMIICSAWRTSTKTQKQRMEIYNCCTGYQNPIKWGQVLGTCDAILRENPVERIVTYPHLTVQSNPLIFSIKQFCTEYIPVHVIHFINSLTGEKFSVLMAYRKLMKTMEIIKVFSQNDWKFVDDNVKALNNLLRVEDQKVFPFDVTVIHWPSYLKDYSLGVRHFILKSNPNSIPACRRRCKTMAWICISVPILLFAVIFYLLFCYGI